MKINSTKKGLKAHVEKAKLTPTQKLILHMITKEFSTVKEISFRRKTSLNAVYKIVRKLREKGCLSYANQEVEKIGWGHTTLNLKRLHAQEFNIKIIYKDHNYKNIRERSNIINLDGNTIRLYRDSLEIYSSKSFQGDTAQKATSASLGYWNRFFARVENELKIIFVKPRSQNILMVKHEYGNPNSPISDAADHRPIKLYAKEDGKLWFSMDNSYNLREHETHHKESAKQDDEVIDKHLNDWRDRDPPKLSELASIMKDTLRLQNEASAGLMAVSKYMESQIPKRPENGLKSSKSTKFSYIG